MIDPEGNEDDVEFRPPCSTFPFPFPLPNGLGAELVVEVVCARFFEASTSLKKEFGGRFVSKCFVAAFLPVILPVISPSNENPRIPSAAGVPVKRWKRTSSL